VHDFIEQYMTNINIPGEKGQKQGIVIGIMC
jgi:hypothetical protein